MDLGYPEDELDPIKCKGKSRNNNPADWAINDVLLGSSLTLLDALDTLAIMGNQLEFENAVRLVINDVHFDLDSRVQVFEVTIRVLGGILAAHLLAGNHELGSYISWYNGELLEMAVDLADRLMPAFDTPYGLPFPRVNLRHGVLKNEVREACTAGAGTLILEFGTLSRLTGNDKYEKAAKKALMEVWRRRSELDLLGTTMNIFDEKWVEEISGIGASSDSFYEYLLKAHILLGGDEYLEIFDQSYKAIQEFVMDSHGFVYKNVNMYTGHLSTHWFDSLAAFFPGLQVLFGDVDLATRPHLLYYTLWQRFGSLPERFNFQTRDTPIESYPLRPELIESTYMLYQATKNPYYLHVGERILDDLERYTKTPCGYVGLKDVRTKSKGDRMESFFLSETLKYLYLLFDVDNSINTMDSNAVFSTEGHFLALPYKYTNKEPSHLYSSNRTCRNPAPLNFNSLSAYFIAPLDPVWGDRCRSFVGTPALMKNEGDLLVSPLFNAVSVILPQSTVSEPSKIVESPDFLLADSVRGKPMTLTLSQNHEIYNIYSLQGLKLRGKRIRAFLDQPPRATSNAEFIGLLSYENKLLFGGVVDFGPILAHGFDVTSSIHILTEIDYSSSAMQKCRGKILIFRELTLDFDLIKIATFSETVYAVAVILHHAHIPIARHNLEVHFTVPILHLEKEKFQELLNDGPSTLRIRIAYHNLLLNSKVMKGKITFQGKDLDLDIVNPPAVVFEPTLLRNSIFLSFPNPTLRTFQEQCFEQCFM